MLDYVSSLNIIFFVSPDRLSGGNVVTSDKVNFRPDIRQSFSFLKKLRTSRVCVTLKQFEATVS